MASTSRLQLSFNAVDLKDDDVFSKSDPYLVLFEVQGNGTNRMLGRTETVRNSLNPIWVTRFDVDFHFESRQDFLVKIFDDDRKGMDGDDYLGHVSFPLAHVVSGRNSRIVKEINFPGKGKLVICAQPITNHGADSVTLRFFGAQLKKMAWIGSTDSYLKVFAVPANGAMILLHQTPTLNNTIVPHWPHLPELSVSRMTTDLDAKTIRIECWQKHLFIDNEIGHFMVSINELMASSGLPASFHLRRDAKPHKSYGRIGVSFAHLQHTPTFLEFLASGLVMNLAVAVDFTGSNGDPRLSTSLHYMNPLRPNQYTRAITSVGSIVLDYDTDKLVAAMGFGGQLPNGQTSHCFHLNAQPNPNVFGLQGILDSYGAALTNVRLSGPTNFAPTIRKASEVARHTEQGLIYQILLIITDGAITDTDDTLDAIVAASELPLSIIIIGVGNADFSTMVVLDGDDVRITDRNGKAAVRDIVQFVPFRDFADGPMDRLGAEVLREVPKQVETWAKALNVTPNIVTERREHSLSFLAGL